jgi:glycosyltransferase involved in cell wall biosynthesis
MAIKLILTQIMKNEAHVAERMLNSIKSIVDGIVVIDTGSTDDSINVVRKWGEANGIETYVFERPFDNFENSRNYSFQKAREIFLNKNDGNIYYNFWLDFDEQIVVDQKFNKQAIDRDLYMFSTYIGKMFYTRNELCRLDKPFKFWGPVHEYIICDTNNITSGLMEGITVNVQMDGGSWKGNIPDKYKKHAFVLEDYIDNKDRNSRWVFYTAQSYHDSASIPDNRMENEERLRRSLKYYKERVSRTDGYEEERFYSQFRIGTIKRALEFPWAETMSELLKAYSMDPLRGEPIKAIIDYYLSVGEWNNAYLFSKAAKGTFHGKNPYPTRLLFVDESLYTWRILEVHSAACFYTGRKQEATETYNELLNVIKRSPQSFTQDDINKINSNAQFFK